MMKLYHGSDIEVSRPLVNIGRKELDFGPGFYVTSLYEQSIKWARRVSVVRNTDGCHFLTMIGNGWILLLLAEEANNYLTFIQSERI